MPPNPEPTERKRVVVDYSLRDYKAIERQVVKQSKERGYRVTMTDVLRKLVRESWGAL